MLKMGLPHRSEKLSSFTQTVHTGLFPIVTSIIQEISYRFSAYLGRRQFPEQGESLSVSQKRGTCIPSHPPQATVLLKNTVFWNVSPPSSG
jgi:hypothetical protein